MRVDEIAALPWGDWESASSHMEALARGRSRWPESQAAGQGPNEWEIWYPSDSTAKVRVIEVQQRTDESWWVRTRLRAYWVCINGQIEDAVILAYDKNDARSLVEGGGEIELGEIAPKVATAMNVPTHRGRHDGILTRWELGPTDLLGDLVIEGFALARKTDQEIWVKHRVSGHVYEFTISDHGAKLLNEHIVVPDLSTQIDAGNLSTSARRERVARMIFKRRPQ
jgi:hypothetical protein